MLLAASVGGVLPLQIMRVESTSMTPTLDSGDVVVVDRTATQVSRMEVVAAEAPGGGLVVKRVVGLGGDRVGIEDGILVVDGVAVCEPDIDPALIDGLYFGPVTVPAGHAFLLGDHRDGSIDSREFGTVPLSSLVGTVTGRLLPSPSSLEPASC